MGASERVWLPGDLAQGVSRFRAWRIRRKAGSRIPETLWALAVRLVKAHAVSRTATVLGLDYYGLKKRAEAADGLPAIDAESDRASGAVTSPVFVELPPPVIDKQCLFEPGNYAGTTMRVQLVGINAAEIATLSRSFWSAE